jgi:hypothetical protein
VSALSAKSGPRDRQATGHWCSGCRGIWFLREVACPVCSNRHGESGFTLAANKSAQAFLRLLHFRTESGFHLQSSRGHAFPENALVETLHRSIVSGA